MPGLTIIPLERCPLEWCHTLYYCNGTVIFRMNPQSAVPVYVQLMENVRGAIEVGSLRPGDPLPGIRRVAEELAVAPNTVAKAYREMQHAGLIKLRHGSGATIANQPSAIASQAVIDGRATMQETVARLRAFGLDEATIRRLLETELAAAFIATKNTEPR
jgi:GntR family transcriptional regulator